MSSIYYHGTTKESAIKILKEQKFKQSTGNKHWLGDGVYFFTNEYYAYTWMEDFHFSKNGCYSKDHTEFIKLYKIISPIIDITEKRMLDLIDNPQHKYLFEIQYKSISDKIVKYGTYSKNELDAVIINVMFKSYSFTDIFDGVKSAFVFHESSAYRANQSIQIQVCIKNISCIKNLHCKKLTKSKYTDYKKLLSISKPDKMYNSRKKQKTVDNISLNVSKEQTNV